MSASSSASASYSSASASSSSASSSSASGVPEFTRGAFTVTMAAMAKTGEKGLLISTAEGLRHLAVGTSQEAVFREWCQRLKLACMEPPMATFLEVAKVLRTMEGMTELMRAENANRGM